MFTVQESEDAYSPDDPEDGCQLHEVLLRQVVARVQLEDQDMIDARGPARKKNLISVTSQSDF